MRKLVKTVLLALCLSYGSLAMAAGIPVGDATNALNQVRQMVQDLNNYKEYLQTTILTDNQLIQAYKEYNAMLEEYKRLYQEASALAGDIEGLSMEEFNNMLADIANQFDPYYGDNKGAIVKDTGNEFWDDAYERNKMLNGYGMTDEEYAQMISSIPYTDDQREMAQRIFEYRQRRVAEGIKRDAYIAQLEDYMKKKEEKAIIELDRQVEINKRDNNLTANVQLLNEQNQHLLKQIDRLQSQQLESMKYQDRLADHYFNRRAAAEARKQKQLQRDFNHD
ncbi:type VI secretion protein [Salmonella enterica]|uniref:Type VI secretion protein n=1 Tax=Salmonella enterica TaxID=28901 RepID=A0A624WE43_SALER|nr:type VI secretion protein [Salmonella enterica]EBQ7118536.1 type VI secretion protein [Salmonella enterica]EBQ7940025.1 type VI secretion protein [Salmonella enterica]ECL8622622.1 type VI secretion protein [Salmonella enterica]ECP5714615.1 type VI secretion protein [Salmonella enterica]